MNSLHLARVEEEKFSKIFSDCSISSLAAAKSRLSTTAGSKSSLIDKRAETHKRAYSSVQMWFSLAVLSAKRSIDSFKSLSISCCVLCLSWSEHKASNTIQKLIARVHGQTPAIMGTSGKCSGNEFRAVSARDGRGGGLKATLELSPYSEWSPPFFKSLISVLSAISSRRIREFNSRTTPSSNSTACNRFSSDWLSCFFDSGVASGFSVSSPDSSHRTSHCNALAMRHKCRLLLLGLFSNFVMLAWDAPIIFAKSACESFSFCLLSRTRSPMLLAMHIPFAVVDLNSIRDWLLSAGGLKEGTHGSSLPWLRSPLFYLFHKDVTSG